ncbi:ABC transporter ATP-binding protein [Microbacterium sp. GXS0129]|uniref:ABC transporter ATP-binding protein n=1 Tax=Microbacterium sp. GXS0129 TaxID=3377836 RepID=UPI00383B664B
MASATDHTAGRSADESTLGHPLMVVDNAHVHYRVYASGKQSNASDSAFSLKAMRGGRGLQTVEAVRGITFSAAGGESIGVIGHNGSGKSTLFRAMSGLLPTTSGRIWAADRPVLLGVNAALMPELSGENNIKLGLLAMGFTQEEAAAQVGPIAEFAELNEFISHPMRTYSSGMAARLKFAIGSAKSHSILLIDEALSVGDRRFRTKSEARIRELRDSAGLVMIVSHSVSSLRDTCERVLWVHKGELRADGAARDVIDEYVRWTKNPGSIAVGAAPSAAKPRRLSAAAKRAAAAAAAAAAADDTAGGGSNAVTNSDSVRSTALTNEPLRGEPARTRTDSIRMASGVATGTRPTAIVSTAATNPRSSARRARYLAAERTKSRRRIAAFSFTGGAILLAAAAGAAISVAANQADRSALTEIRASVSAPPTSSPTPSAVPVLPVINEFTSSTPTAFCESVDSSTEVSLIWNVSGATSVSVAVATADGASTEFLLTDQSLAVPSQPVVFPCANESTVYTLVTTNAGGQQVTSTVTVTRELAPETTPEEVEEPPAEPTEEPIPPVVSEPPAEPSPSPSVPTTEPTIPTEPTTEPTVGPTTEPTDPPPTEGTTGDAP